jgi:hypothetical protein
MEKKNDNTNNKKTFTLEDIIQENIIIANNITTTNTNNITNNTIYMINPFGFENIDHIDLNNFQNISNSDDRFYSNLIKEIYHNNDYNKNFFKKNMNNKIINYLSPQFTIEELEEDKFLELLNKYIFQHYLELVDKFKTSVPFNDAVNFIMAILFQEKKIENNNNYAKQIKESIIAKLDKLYRNKKTQTILENTIDNFKINNNSEILKLLCNKKQTYNKLKIEYNKTDNKTDNKINNELQLCNLKKIASQKIIKHFKLIT